MSDEPRTTTDFYKLQWTPKYTANQSQVQIRCMLKKYPTLGREDKILYLGGYST
jgi:hypothetical protein